MKKLKPIIKCPYCGKEVLINVRNEDLIRFLAQRLKVRVNVEEADS